MRLPPTPSSRTSPTRTRPTTSALPAGSYDLEVRLAGTTTVALPLPGVAVEACNSYSVFAIGSAASPAVGGNALQVVVAVDATVEAEAPRSGAAPDPTGNGHRLPRRRRRAATPAWGPRLLLLVAGAVTFAAVSLRPATRRVRERPGPGLGRRMSRDPADPPRPGPGGATVMNLTDLIDDALEISVVGSFSRIGYAVRRRLFGWTPAEPGSLSRADRPRHRSDVRPRPGRRPRRSPRSVPGSSSSGAARTGWPTCATRSSGPTARTASRSSWPTWPSLRSVRAAAERILANEPRLDVLIDNAGAIFPERTESPDGIEATLATMVVGPFALIAGLLPLLRRTGRARVIAVTSGGMYAQRLDLDDLEWTTAAYDGTRAYARAKRAQVALIREWARRVPPVGGGVHRDASGLGGHTRARRRRCPASAV